MVGSFRALVLPKRVASRLRSVSPCYAFHHYPFAQSGTVALPPLLTGGVLPPTGGELLGVSPLGIYPSMPGVKTTLRMFLSAY